MDPLLLNGQNKVQSDRVTVFATTMPDTLGFWLTVEAINHAAGVLDWLRSCHRLPR